MSQTPAMAWEYRELLLETAADVFSRSTPIMGRDSHGEAELARRVWRDVEQADLGRLGTATVKGGAGGSLSDAGAVLRMAARFAPPIPLAETQLATWLVTEAGLSVPPGPLAVAPTRFGLAPKLGRDGFAGGDLLGIPFAGLASHLVVLAESEGSTWAAVLDLSGVEVVPAPSLSGEPWATVRLKGAKPLGAAPVAVGLDDLLARGALMRSQQIAGALSKILELTISYAGERVQFGRPIARFQAIQHHLADIAGETVAAGVAAEAAIELAEAGRLLEAAAIAKSRTGLAARAAAVAHQVHGAIGVTEEHPLHLFTRRIWDWRDDFGSDFEWSGRLGRKIAGAGPAALWPEVSAIV
jgi:acyl-CoA dehydrogenase